MAYSLLQALNISRQDMINRLADLDVVSNNLANENTIGYKSNRTNFKELLSGLTRDGSKLQNTQILTQQGSTRPTGNAMDWSIEGDGFFQVHQADGTIGYTRDGQFQLDGSGNLVNTGGNILVFTGTVPKGAQTVSVSPDGTLTALMAGGIGQPMGTMNLARFANESGLIAHGNNIMLPSANSGQPITGAPNSANFGVVRSGSLEQSNVNIADEMTDMTSLQRAFQMSVRAFQQSDTMITEAIHMRKA